MVKDIREINALIKEEKMARLLLRARVKLSKLGLTVDQLKSAVASSKDWLKARYPGVFKEKT